MGNFIVGRDQKSSLAFCVQFEMPWTSSNELSAGGGERHSLSISTAALLYTTARSVPTFLISACQRGIFFQ